MLTKEYLESLEKKYLDDFPFVDPKMPHELFCEIKKLKKAIDAALDALGMSYTAYEIETEVKPKILGMLE